MAETYQIIPRDFYGNRINFIEKEKDIWVTAEALGIGLEYKNPRISIMNLYSSHEDEIEEYKGVIELVTPGGNQKTTVFNEMGAYLLIMFSNQPKAKEFRKWIASVIKEIRKTGSYSINKCEPGSSEWIIQQLDAMKAMAVKQLEHEKKLASMEQKVLTVDSELKSFEQKYEDEKLITPKTMKFIQDTVHNAKKRTGLHWNVFYSKIWDHFGISSIKGNPEKLGQKIVDWLKNHPFFKKHVPITISGGK